ncbi:hypothetical protein FA95DRAFT_1552308 [Auriscalpium vulgare]|uniref:Uncharacterized protein n=1 Tax=Auriscalpium vulgare TaxID=40419 RepID=A0ACB8SCC7_9AGAM|nr:hypothetical protein FA95DRAFT_1552308 [Auriscalpium vulgare]
MAAIVQRPQLAVLTSLPSEPSSDDTMSPNSLFDESGEPSPAVTPASITVRDSLLPPASIAQRTAPPIPGLYFDPTLRLPPEFATSVLQQCMATFFTQPDANQAMLFGRAHADPASTSDGLPPFLRALLAHVDALLRPLLPPATHGLLFPPPSGGPPCARQAIVNLYRPGEGIAPHVDLLRRFGDGIVGVSLGSGCVMNFRREDEADADAEAGLERTWDVFLPEGSVLVLSGDARYRWTHGIEGRVGEWVEGEGEGTGAQWVQRGVRVSITFRWLLPGADIVGGME